MSFRQYLHPAPSGKCAEAQQPGLKNLTHGRKRLAAGLANAVPPSPQNLVGLLKSTKTHNSDSLRQCCRSGSPCFWASWVRIHRIHVLLSLLNPDPPDPRVFGPPGSGSGSISQRYGSRSGSFYLCKNSL
jgi:hypothetical protein